MSEPSGAFLKLRVSHAGLVSWLESPPIPASAWSDWRRIGGAWHVAGGGAKPLADYDATQYAGSIDDCDSILKRYANVRAALRDILDAAVAPQLKRASFDAENQELVAGTPTYAENLTLFIVFFAIARSAAPFLAVDGHGVAAVHNYLWGGESEQTTVAALRLGPGHRSEFMAPDDAPSASAAFQSIVDEMLDAKDESTAIDQLDALK